jgi:hypothetical protein
MNQRYVGFHSFILAESISSILYIEQAISLCLFPLIPSLWIELIVLERARVTFITANFIDSFDEPLLGCSPLARSLLPSPLLFILFVTSLFAFFMSPIHLLYHTFNCFLRIYISLVKIFYPPTSYLLFLQTSSLCPKAVFK